MQTLRSKSGCRGPVDCVRDRYRPRKNKKALHAGARTKLQHVQIDGGGVVHYDSVMLAGEDTSSATHVGRELIDFVNSRDGVPDYGRIAEIPDDELIRPAARRNRAASGQPRGPRIPPIAISLLNGRR
jgi:hypothetical protein